MNAKSVGTLAVVVAALVGAAYFIGTQQGGNVSTQTSTTTTTITSTTTGGSSGSPNGLQLQLSANASTSSSNQGVSFQISVGEYNTLAKANNVTKANDWKLNGLSLGPCGTAAYPFGVALYRGSYTADNASSAQPLRIYPTVACPMLIRYVTGYLFQPTSNLAVVLPGGPGAVPAPMSANVTANAEYKGGFSSSSSGMPLAPGTYTVAAGDEWGSLVFIHITIGVVTTITSSTSAGTMGTLEAAFNVGPIAPVCRANATTGPAGSLYSSIQAVITPLPSGQAVSLPFTWLSNGCSVYGTLQASLAPGSYSLSLSTCQFMGCGASLPKTFTIVAGQTTTLNVSIDTGIR